MFFEKVFRAMYCSFMTVIGYRIVYHVSLIPLMMVAWTTETGMANIIQCFTPRPRGGLGIRQLVALKEGLLRTPGFLKPRMDPLRYGVALSQVWNGPLRPDVAP